MRSQGHSGQALLREEQRPVKEQPLCIECRWCDLRVDFDSGSNYYCERTGEALTAAILQRKACKDFKPAPAAAHWGA